MSKYLERLAASARKPGGAIHPMVGSVYSAARIERAFPLIEEEEVIAPPQAVAAPAIADELESQSVFEPLLAPARSASPVSQGETRAAEPMVEPLQTGQRISETRPASTPPKYQLAPTGAHSAPHPELLPLISDEPRALEIQESSQKPWGIVPTPPFRTIVTPQAEPKKRMASPVSMERGYRRQMQTPDEIQIHIGRIEITAAPPPAPRPAPQQPRKSLDLGEYLKRGRGRSS